MAESPACDARVTCVVPVLNGMRFLPATMPTLLGAADRAHVEIVYVDNGSTDGTSEYLRAVGDARVRVLSCPGASIAALRNRGARAGTGDFLSFLDADCAVPPDYFASAVQVLRESGAAATGCETHVPEEPHWIEDAWHDMHYDGRERDVHYLNSANFFISRAAFDAVRGFREDLATGEDSDIGQRLTAAGFRIRASSRVKAIHYGNPRSLRDFYRRSVWHGLGMFATVNLRQVDKPTAMTALHLVVTMTACALLLTGVGGLAMRVGGVLVSQLVAPAATVAFRMGQTGKRPALLAALFLYWLYYWSRIQAAVLVFAGRGNHYRKSRA